jgi:hypothetical protein
MDINELLIPEKAITAIEDGHWVDDIIGLPGIRLKVRGLSSRKVSDYRDSRVRRVSYKDKDSKGNIKPEAMNKITRDVLIETVLLDWEGFTANGKPLPYSKETARKFLESRSGDKILGFVTEAALQVDDLQNRTAEELEKN